jgi:hypothetical protein
MLAEGTSKYDVQLDRVTSHDAVEFMTAGENVNVMIYQKPLADQIVRELGMPYNLPLSRGKVTLQPGDEALVASYHGPRFDGDQPLPADTRLSYWRVSLFEGVLEAA